MAHDRRTGTCTHAGRTLNAPFMNTVTKNIRLLATDLDGTLVRPPTEHALCLELLAVIDQIRKKSNSKWVICSGRGKRSFMRIWSSKLKIGLRPDYLILRGAYIYSHTKWGFYRPHLRWNRIIHRVLRTNRKLIAQLLPEWNRAATARFPGVETVVLAPNYLLLRSSDATIRKHVLEMLQDKRRPFKNILIREYAQQIEVQTMPFGKGLALFDLAQHLHIPANQVLAIGNGLNDVSMMTFSATALTGCPANADTTLMNAVHGMGGHIASKAGIAGVLETIHAHQTGNVASDLPANWQKRIEEKQNKRPKRRTHHRRRGFSRENCLFAMIAITIVLVLAHFGILPRVLAKPLHVAAQWAQRLLGGGGEGRGW